MNNKNLKPEESIKIIEAMIEATREKIRDNGAIWLIWGWYVIIASLSQYTLNMIGNIKYSWLGWMLWPICLVFTIYTTFKKHKETNVKTHIDSFMSSFWTAFGIAIAITIIFTMQVNQLVFLPFCMILYGIGTFTTGGVINFKPLKYGGLISFLCAAIAFKTSYNEQLILIALAVLASYIIPGYILKNQYKKENVKTA